MNSLPNLSFPPTSRYYSIVTKKLETADGKEINYLSRRFIPAAQNFTLLQEHVVEEGDRLDNVTAQYLNDPQQFWRIADANNAMNPNELTAEIGRRLRITLPEGVQGLPNVVS